MTTIDLYPQQCSSEKRGRSELVQLLLSVYTDTDYTGLFFNKSNREDKERCFKVDPRSLFSHKILVQNEAVDKMAYFSPLLHMFYLHSYANGIRRDTVFSFVLFFGHQCNSTVTVVSSMLHMLMNNEIYSQTKLETFYTYLARSCCHLKGIPMTCKDVGSGQHNRHQSSNNSIYSDTDVRKYIIFLTYLFAEYSTV